MGMKANSGFFNGTRGSLKYNINLQHFSIKNIIKNLPNKPDKLVDKGWVDVTHPTSKIKSNSTEYKNPKTGHRIRFDKGDDSKNGFSSTDHYHVYNPKSTGNSDLYLDKNGNPVKKNSKASHLLPKGGSKK